MTTIEQMRLKLAANTDAQHKAQLGQFLTPASTARFMAGLFDNESGRICRLLDPGAGIGSLSSAFLDRCVSGQLAFQSVHLAAFELDAPLHSRLESVLASYRNKLDFSYEVIGTDFIEEAVNRIQFAYGGQFTHVILNPPYKKIGASSRYRRSLRQVDIEAVNLYSAFVALALKMMAPGGQLVAIIPRSFCNGPYYAPFRALIAQYAAIRHLHLFASRTSAFKDDGVLQENVIIKLERDGRQGNVVVTTSTDDRFSDLVTHTYPFERIVFPDDPGGFIHVPTVPGLGALEQSEAIRYSLEELGIAVSTGPVVDFRLKEYLVDQPEPGTVPLLYPAHFGRRGIEWPKPDIKKPNALRHVAETEKWMYPSGFYCVVRRFSSKEERRRIVANVVDGAGLSPAPLLAFENHLNVFHEQKHGLSEALARGLGLFLNTTAVDQSFRRFSGHTQVNATDLRMIKYPSREVLIALGEWAMRHHEPTQAELDEQLERLAG